MYLVLVPDTASNLPFITRIFDLLIANGADLTQTDADGNTILHWAIPFGRVELVPHIITAIQTRHGSSAGFNSAPLKPPKTEPPAAAAPEAAAAAGGSSS